MSDLPIKSLSIRQPWAWAIINAGKDIENRNWATKFRGPVCIHAAKGMTNLELQKARRFILDTQYRLSSFDPPRALVPGPQALVKRGGIIGVAEIVDCVEASESPWFMGRYGFVLANVRPVPFIPVRGSLRFFSWRKSLEVAP